MQRVYAAIVLFAYVALVPLCFFGAPTTSSHSMQMEHMDMSGQDSSSHTQDSNTEDASAAHHLGVYHSATESLLFAIITCLLVLIFVSLPLGKTVLLASARFFTKKLFAPPKRQPGQVLSWLATKETSPPRM